VRLKMSKEGADQIIKVQYTNYRGETAIRTIWPIDISFKSTEYHPEQQWILRALDVDKGQQRDFALRDMVFLKGDL
jgi:hypothetical protein